MKTFPNANCLRLCGVIPAPVLYTIKNDNINELILENLFIDDSFMDAAVKVFPNLTIVSIRNCFIHGQTDIFK
jgi:hypothetical protein